MQFLETTSGTQLLPTSPPTTCCWPVRSCWNDYCRYLRYRFDTRQGQRCSCRHDRRRSGYRWIRWPVVEPRLRQATVGNRNCSRLEFLVGCLVAVHLRTKSRAFLNNRREIAATCNATVGTSTFRTLMARCLFSREETPFPLPIVITGRTFLFVVSLKLRREFFLALLTINPLVFRLYGGLLRLSNFFRLPSF